VKVIAALAGASILVLLAALAILVRANRGRESDLAETLELKRQLMAIIDEVLDFSKIEKWS